MELLLLGSAAAEGWPAPFCVCPHCETARRRGGPNIRTRSNSLLDDDFKIDYCADVLMQMQRCGRSLAKMRTLVFTHQHSDHLMPLELNWIAPPFTQTPPPEPIVVYGNQQVIDALRGPHPEAEKKLLDLHVMKPLEPVTTPSGDVILPMPADHVEGALVLRITRNGQHLFYGHDSGLYPEPTLNALSDGTPLDIALMDCTNGGHPTSNRGHMGVTGVVQMTEELRRRGAITDATRVIATHFSHNGGLLHEELVKAFLPHGIEVAYDNMTVKVEAGG